MCIWQRDVNPSSFLHSQNKSPGGAKVELMPAPNVQAARIEGCRSCGDVSSFMSCRNVTTSRNFYPLSPPLLGNTQDCYRIYKGFLRILTLRPGGQKSSNTRVSHVGWARGAPMRFQFGSHSVTPVGA